MRVAVLSDIHANRQALDAVAKDLEAQNVDRTWCLGDIVGYGASPLECLEWTARHADLVVQGNHDHAVASGDVTWFNPVAAQAARYHAQILSPADRARLYALPEREMIQLGDCRVLLVHGSPDDPLHEYVRPLEMQAGFQRWQGRADVILMGHTHMPALGTPVNGARAWRTEKNLYTVHPNAAAPDVPVLLNPGSVGQPRDADPRAAYLILDFETRRATLRRVSYDVEAAAHAILEAELDPSLAARLLRGR